MERDRLLELNLGVSILFYFCSMGYVYNREINWEIMKLRFLKDFGLGL